jgi:hypothetical protein
MLVETTKRRRNDEERRIWVLNDEGLYLWHRASRQHLRQFIRDNRTEIDAAIDRVLDKPARH